MKYYIGRVIINDYASHREYLTQACLAANTEAQATALLDTWAGSWDNDGRKDDNGYTYSDNGQAFYKVSPFDLTEISPAAFVDLRKVLTTFGEVEVGELEAQSVSEQARTLARRIGDQLKKHDAKVSHSRLLHAVAASLGESDWQVLVHKQVQQAQQAPQDVPRALTADDEWAGKWPQNGQTQPFVPGEGYLWRVPVTVNTTMTAFVEVRARDSQEAQQLAREFASNGNAKFDVDEGIYRGLGDHYVGDEDSVERIDDREPAAPNEEYGVQVGPYLVELTSLGDADDAMLWADLTVFDPSVAEEAEADSHTCMSACPEDISSQEARAFCLRAAQMLFRAVPNPADIDNRALENAFIEAVQGEQTDAALQAIETKLRSQVRP